MPTEHQRIVTLEDRTYVEGVYSIVNPQLAQTRNNKPYLKCIIRDASGEISGRAWSFEESQFDAVTATGFVFLRGSTQAYQGQIQLIIEQIEAREVSVEEMRALLPSTTKDIDAMFGRVCELLRSMEHPAMRALAEQYLCDERLMEDFRAAPAAMSVHHGWIGGLLEHTHQLMELADRMLPLYPALNRDIVLFSLFAHDLGKTVARVGARLQLHERRPADRPHRARRRVASDQGSACVEGREAARRDAARLAAHPDLAPWIARERRGEAACDARGDLRRDARQPRREEPGRGHRREARVRRRRRVDRQGLGARDEGVPARSVVVAAAAAAAAFGGTDAGLSGRRCGGGLWRYGCGFRRYSAFRSKPPQVVASSLMSVRGSVMRAISPTQPARPVSASSASPQMDAHRADPAIPTS